MAGAFQTTAFQNTAFQTDGGGGGPVTYTDDFSLDAILFKTQSASFALDAYIILQRVEDDFSLEAALKKVFEPNVYVTGPPTVVAASSNSVSSGDTVTVGTPAGSQTEDVLVAVVGGQFGTFSAPTFVSPVEDGWTQLDGLVVSATTPRYTAYAFYRFVDDPSATYSFQVFAGSLSTPETLPKSAGIVAFRDAGIPIHRGFDFQTESIGAKTAPEWGVPTSDQNYGASILVLGTFSGRGTPTTTWTPSSGSLTEHVDTGVSGSNLFMGTWPDALHTIVPGRSATPSQAEMELSQSIHIPSRTTQYHLKAFIQPGDTFSIDAFIQAIFHTTHPRTGPHYGVHPSDVIVTSATLGSLPPGTDLNTVIADLDALLTDLET